MDLTWDFFLNAALVTIILAIGTLHYLRGGTFHEIFQGEAKTASRPSSPTRRTPPVAATTQASPQSVASPAAGSTAREPAEGLSTAGMDSKRDWIVPAAKLGKAPTAAEAAAQSAVANADKSTVRYKGKVKRYSERNGMGFITCRQLQEKFGADVRFYREEVEAANLEVGSVVSFLYSLGGRPGCPKGHAWAVDCIRLEGADAELSDEDVATEPRRRREARVTDPDNDDAASRKPQSRSKAKAKAKAADADEFAPVTNVQQDYASPPGFQPGPFSTADDAPAVGTHLDSEWNREWGMEAAGYQRLDADAVAASYIPRAPSTAISTTFNVNAAEFVPTGVAPTGLSSSAPEFVPGGNNSVFWHGGAAAGIDAEGRGATWGEDSQRNVLEFVHMPLEEEEMEEVML